MVVLIAFPVVLTAALVSILVHHEYEMRKIRVDRRKH